MTILKTLLKFSTLAVFLFSNYFASLQASTLYPSTSHVDVVRCIEKERQALLKFKEDAVDSLGLIFSSWSGHDCCTWKGVGCSYPNGEVVKLHLAGNSLGGKISNHLNELTHLKYLNLSYNDFSGMIPPQIGNLSNLHVLDLGYVGQASGIIVSDLHWISCLSSLKYLDLTYINLSLAKTHWLQAINYIPSLEELRISYCILDTIHLSVSQFNLTSLYVLDLSYNRFKSPVPRYFSNLSTNLEVISLSFCGFTIFSLEHLKSLRKLDLFWNSISGSLPTSIGKLSKLEFLNLNNNKMNGSIPKSLGRLANLKFLDLMLNEWEGTLSQDHFEYLSKLRTLRISSSSGRLDLKLSFDWVPPFSLTEVYIRDCDVGSKFPLWLETQTQLEFILLQNSSISDTIPNWFWKLSPLLDSLKLSDNQLGGSIPFNIGQMMPSIRDLDLSNNSLNGNIPLSLGNMSKLQYLKLSNNHLSGKNHDKWTNNYNIYQIDFSNNNLSGELPSSLFTLPSHAELKLSNNNIVGELPISLTTSSKSISFIDLGDNKLSGNISKWIVEGYTSLRELRMRGTMFHGSITEQFCRLQSLRVLDFAQNNLSGPIPPCLSRLSAMYSIYGNLEETLSMDLNLKGNKYTYRFILNFVRAIDLSCNHLSGIIPEDITNLKGLCALNLSNNHLTGKIPARIGEMLNLETLDLSSNQIYGQIPPSISSMTALSHLNLSHNNLSGLIPSGTQLSTFNEKVYEGNSGLCGRPLSTPCGLPAVQKNLGEDDTNYKDGKLRLYVSVALGFVFGFWSICGTLVAKKPRRRTYFGFIDKIIDQIALILAMNWNRFYKMIAKKGTN